MSTNSSVESQTSRKRISIASDRASTWSDCSSLKRRTTSLLYRFQALGCGSRDPGLLHVCFSFEMPQMLSMTESRSLVQGRREVRDWWTNRNCSGNGSDGAGVVISVPAGTAVAGPTSKSAAHKTANIQCRRSILQYRQDGQCGIAGQGAMRTCNNDAAKDATQAVIRRRSGSRVATALGRAGIRAHLQAATII